jgi:hypothetical protein
MIKKIKIKEVIKKVKEKVMKIAVKVQKIPKVQKIILNPITTNPKVGTPTKSQNTCLNTELLI